MRKETRRKRTKRIEQPVQVWQSKRPGGPWEAIGQPIIATKRYVRVTVSVQERH